MPARPPSPQTPVGRSLETDDGRTLATTAQLAASIEATTGYRLDEATLEAILLEFDRGDYVEWTTVTRDGEYVWDLTETPDRIGDAVATAILERIHSWLGDETTP
ncbi:hypothetical protein [Natronorubrum aibiense]|uniref:Uncharacterized protein n=1 Tax=Natronorubrum aibiense TaxID=348826 RepID=A0A5P9P0B3_9EURY|nr:hypothetical protein [Natronorubrum aibiense]QFU81517.1 hypothetical protein GCU68_02535 [Natronorubrum aibiense]